MTLAEKWREFRRTRTPLWRFSPEPRLAVALALVAPLWLVPGRAGNIIGGVAIGVVLLLVVVDVLMLPARRGIRVSREVPESIGIGDEESGSFTLANRASHTLVVTLEDSLPALVEGGVH